MSFLNLRTFKSRGVYVGKNVLGLLEFIKIHCVAARGEET